VVLLKSAGGGDRYDDTTGTYGRPFPSLSNWSPLAVELGEQAEMCSLPGQVVINFLMQGAGDTWVSLAVTVHNR
jgi:hypothetical protein